MNGRTAFLFWVDAAGSAPQVTWQPAGVRREFPQGLHIDLFRETGLRLWFYEEDNATELLSQFHHSCCDGLGALKFLETLLECYASPGHRQPPPGWDSRHTLRQQVGCPRGAAWKELSVLVGNRHLPNFPVRPSPTRAAGCATRRDGHGPRRCLLPAGDGQPPV